jgi:acyl-CoA synthetase (AMP-forming)/AMP-acid ligase II
MTFPREGESGSLLQDLLAASAARRAEQVAVIVGAERFTYAELESRARGLAATLCARGVAPGDRVVIFGDNTLEVVLAFWATLMAGGVAVVTSALARAERVAYVLEDTGATALVTFASLAPAFLESATRSAHLRVVIVAGALPGGKLQRLPGGVHWEEAEASSDRAAAPAPHGAGGALAAIIYTSGSTGQPKGVMHTHASLRAAARAIVEYLGLAPHDVLFGALPFAFGYGLFQLIAATAVGGTLVVERGFAFPASVLARLSAERVTCLAGVPSVLALLDGVEKPSDVDLSCVRIVTNAAAALSSRHVEIVRRLFPRAVLFSMYGQTECIRGTYVPPAALARKPTSIGIPIPYSEAWLVDEHDRRVAPGEVGQLVLKSPHVMSGYWKRPAETAAKLRPGPLGERVLYTGDLATRDEEGFFHFVARMDDIIKSRGEKVAPVEVERVIMDLPGVREVAVIGVEDDLLGQAIKAILVVDDRDGRAKLTAGDVLQHCRARLESYKVPKHVAFVDDLPRTTNGKTAKAALS